MPTADLSEISCNVCRKTGGLRFEKVYRFSKPLVLIGWLFLLPSFLGISCGTCGLFATGKASSDATQEMVASYERRLTEIPGISAEQARLIARIPSPDRNRLQQLGLSERQIDAVETAHSQHLAGQAGAAIGGGLLGGASIMVIVASFIGGVFGWILVLRKKVIACRNCHGVHSEAV